MENLKEERLFYNKAIFLRRLLGMHPARLAGIQFIFVQICSIWNRSRQHSDLCFLNYSSYYDNFIILQLHVVFREDILCKEKYDCTVDLKHTMLIYC